MKRYVPAPPVFGPGRNGVDTAVVPPVTVFVDVNRGAPAHVGSFGPKIVNVTVPVGVGEPAGGAPIVAVSEIVPLVLRTASVDSGTTSCGTSVTVASSESFAVKPLASTPLTVTMSVCEFPATPVN